MRSAAKVDIVTGAGTVIGGSTTIALLRLGCSVASPILAFAGMTCSWYVFIIES